MYGYTCPWMQHIFDIFDMVSIWHPSNHTIVDQQKEFPKPSNFLFFLFFLKSTYNVRNSSIQQIFAYSSLRSSLVEMTTRESVHEIIRREIVTIEVSHFSLFLEENNFENETFAAVFTSQLGLKFWGKEIYSLPHQEGKQTLKPNQIKIKYSNRIKLKSVARINVHCPWKFCKKRLVEYLQENGWK